MLWGCSGSAGLPEDIREQLEETESTGLETADPQEQVQEVLENSVGYQQETIGEEELNQRYYYSLLDAESRQIYRELVQGIREGQEVIVTHGDDPAAVNGICTWVFMDYPEFFWCSGTVETTSYTGAVAYCEVRPEYTCTAEERTRRQQQIDEAAGAVPGRNAGGTGSSLWKKMPLPLYLAGGTDRVCGRFHRQPEHIQCFCQSQVGMRRLFQSVSVPGRYRRESSVCM